MLKERVIEIQVSADTEGTSEAPPKRKRLASPKTALAEERCEAVILPGRMIVPSGATLS